MFDNILYPKEVAEVMSAVLRGEYGGLNPEQHIDCLLRDFYQSLSDKKIWISGIIKAVQQLGCLDCVFARLNLECLLDNDAGNRIVIKYNRQYLLPGENHGIGCSCFACLNKIPELTINNTNIDQDITQELGPDGEPVVSYPDDQKVLDELEHNFYASEHEIYHEPPKPSLSDERKIEILETIRQTGYRVVDTRQRALDRLELLFKKRTIEQNIVARICYLLISEALKSPYSNKLLVTIGPRGLYNKLGN